VLQIPKLTHLIYFTDPKNRYARNCKYNDSV